MKVFCLVILGALAANAFGINVKDGNLLNPVKLLLYTNSNPDNEEIITASMESIKKSKFNADFPIRFFIHGWVQTKKTEMSTQMRHALFKKGNYNFIFVQWDRALSADYAASAEAVSGVGEHVAGFIDFLSQDLDIPMANIWVIGHSLGAQISGFIGKNVKSGQLTKIVCLDPARPLFEIRNSNNRLDKSDALYVESIQTDGGKLGFEEPMGHATFYVNGGKDQPGCGADVTSLCSHRRSVDYYIETLLNIKYCSIRCQNYTNDTLKGCGSTFSNVTMGADENEFVAKGIFYVPIKQESPYGISC